MNKRPDWNTYYLDIAKAVSARSTCLRRRYGAIIVKDNAIISTGYNGAPVGETNCIDTGKCVRKEMHIPHGERYELCVAVHAEQNALIRADREALKGATLYLYGENAETGETLKAAPCKLCERMIKNAGIKNIVCSC